MSTEDGKADEVLLHLQQTSKYLTGFFRINISNFIRTRRRICLLPFFFICRCRRHLRVCSYPKQTSVALKIKCEIYFE